MKHQPSHSQGAPVTSGRMSRDRRLATAYSVCIHDPVYLCARRSTIFCTSSLHSLSLCGAFICSLSDYLRGEWPYVRMSGQRFHDQRRLMLDSLQKSASMSGIAFGITIPSC